MHCHKISVRFAFLVVDTHDHRYGSEYPNLSLSQSIYQKIDDNRQYVHENRSIQSTDSSRCRVPDMKIPPGPGTNQIAGFVELHPLTSRKKDKKLLRVVKSNINKGYWKRQ